MLELKEVSNIKQAPPLCKVCSYKHMCMPEKIVNEILINENVNEIVRTISLQKSFNKGEMIYSQGDSFSSIYVVRSGCVQTYSLDEKGEELVEGIFYPGEFLALDCISFKRYSHFAMAREDSDVCKVNYHQLESFSREEPEMALHISKAISGQLSRQLKWSQAIASGDVKKRLCSWIVITSSKLGITEKDSFEFTLPINHYEIAKMLRMRPESLSRLIKELNKGDLIQISNKKCLVKDRDLLLAQI